MKLFLHSERNPIFYLSKGRIHYWNVCHRADGPFDTVLLLQSGEITEYDM